MSATEQPRSDHILSVLTLREAILLIIPLIIIHKIWIWYTATYSKHTYKLAPPLLSAEDEKTLMEVRKVAIDPFWATITSDSSYEEQLTAISKALQANAIPVEKLLISNTHDLFLIHRELSGKYEGGLLIRSTVQV